MKNKEELKNLKEEVENEKLQELTEEEIAQVTGGVDPGINDKQHEIGDPKMKGSEGPN